MKRKIRIFLNIVLFVVCVGSLAFGVYSAKTAKLNVSGNVGFTAHNCKVDVYGYIYGHSTAPNEEPIEGVTNLKKPDGSEATSASPLKIDGTTVSLTFGTVYFSDLGSTNTKPEDITIVLTITNTSEYFPVLIEDTATDSPYSNYAISCSNPLSVLYLSSDEEKTTTVTYTLSAKQNAEGNYDNITTPVSISIGMNFSKIDADAVGKTTDGWEVRSDGYLTAVPTKAQNNNSDMLIIPASVTNGTTTTPVSIISNSGMSLTNLSSYKKVVILKGVTSIGSSAFYYCRSLKSVAIPSSVNSIGSNAFDDCGALTSITIPSNVSIINSQCFFHCSSLTSITIPSSVTSIKDSAFASCTSLTSITIPSNVTSIGYNAFSVCTSLTSITIPSNVTSIGYGVFSSCSNLNSVTFETTEGWWYTGDSSATSGEPISPSDLENASTAATLLKNDLEPYYLKRT